MEDGMAVILILLLVFLYLIYRMTISGNYPHDIPLSPGTYRIGEDLDPGKGDMVATAGSGDISILERGNGVWSNNFKLHVDSPSAPSRYRNLTLHPHDVLEINGSIKVMLTPPTAFTATDDIELCLGCYQFGIDIPAAKYDLQVTAGDGQITFYKPKETEYSFYQDMNAAGDGKSNEYKNLQCDEGARLTVEGTLKVTLTKSAKQHGFMQKLLDHLNQQP